jgi:hypothetical protein
MFGLYKIFFDVKNLDIDFISKQRKQLLAIKKLFFNIYQSINM